MEDVSILKSDSFLGKWQLCATLNITRGASRASCSLAVPVIAANLKIEFAEFYDRPGQGSKSTGGSFLVHCPRCTRVVQNAHGVCGNCGEVACKSIHDKLGIARLFCFPLRLLFSHYFVSSKHQNPNPNSPVQEMPAHQLRPTPVFPLCRVRVLLSR